MVLSYLVRPGIPHTDPGESHRSNRLRIPGKRSLRRSLTFFHSLECHRVEFNQDNRGGAGGDGKKDVFDVHIESIANGGNVVKYYSEITSSPEDPGITRDNGIRSNKGCVVYCGCVLDPATTIRMLVPSFQSGIRECELQFRECHIKPYIESISVPSVVVKY